MKRTFHPLRSRRFRGASSGRLRGFTLVELSLAMCLGLMIAAMSMTLINQQLTFLRIYRSQLFLIEEAPLINRTLSKMIGQAERFRLHPTKANAVSGSNARLTASPVLLLQFRQPDGTMRSTIMSFEKVNGRDALAYYVLDASGAAAATPDFVITRRASNISFEMVNGILEVTLTGPSGEEIVYSGTTQS